MTGKEIRKSVMDLITHSGEEGISLFSIENHLRKNDTFISTPHDTRRLLWSLLSGGIICYTADRKFVLARAVQTVVLSGKNFLNPRPNYESSSV